MLLSFLLLLFPADVFSGQATLTWNAPTTNADGTPITYFSGDYRIYYGTASGNYSQVTNLNNSNGIVTQQVPNLTSGQLYFFVVTAVNTLGNESAYSNEISKTAQSGTPTTFTITASAGANGTISPAGTTLVNTGASQAYSITPRTGYQVVSVLVDGSSSGTVTSYTFSNVTANHTISATFAIITPLPIFPGTSGLYWDDVNKRIGINVASPQYTMDVVAPDTLMQFSSNTTDNTAKIARMVLRHYNNAQLPLYLFGAVSTANDNFIAFGGSSPLDNAATQIDFFTAPNNTTPIGTSRLTINGDGNVGIGTTTPAEKLEVNGGLALYTTDARPVCNINTRGTFWFTQDNINGDRADVCAKVGGAYAWRKLF